MMRPISVRAEQSRIASATSATGFTVGCSAMAYFFKRRFDEAAAKLLLSIEDHPGFPPAYRTLASCYARMGGSTKLMQSPSSCAPSPLKPWRNPADRELLPSGLRLAAGEEV